MGAPCGCDVISQNPLSQLQRSTQPQPLAALLRWIRAKATTVAYGDVIQQLEDRAAIWGGDKITLFASDGISTAFQFEVRLDQLITLAEGNTGAAPLERPVQALFDGLYFPIPRVLEGHLVPVSSQEIRIAVHCDSSWPVLSDPTRARGAPGARFEPGDQNRSALRVDGLLDSAILGRGGLAVEKRGAQRSADMPLTSSRLLTA